MAASERGRAAPGTRSGRIRAGVVLQADDLLVRQVARKQFRPALAHCTHTRWLQAQKHPGQVLPKGAPLYEEFYGLREKPFNKTPDPRFLYQGSKHGEALARMQLAVDDQDIVLLTGEIGSGKTTLSRALIDSLDRTYHPVLIINPRLTPMQLVRTVALRLGIEHLGRFREDILEGINAKLYEFFEAGKRTLLVIDEAQLIPGKDTFEELRLLTNFQLDDRNLLALVLIGQTELRSLLERKQYRALRQRISMEFHLTALDEAETREYVAHRLRVAGREEPLFDTTALSLLYEASGGVPRRINIIAGNALLEGFGREASTIGAEIIESVVRDH